MWWNTILEVINHFYGSCYLKEKAMTPLLQYSPEQRKEYYTKHGGLIIGKTPDGKDRWSGIDWVALAKELGAIK